jgi:hypothetical protein
MVVYLLKSFAFFFLVALIFTLSLFCVYYNQRRMNKVNNYNSLFFTLRLKKSKDNFFFFQKKNKHKEAARFNRILR